MIKKTGKTDISTVAPLLTLVIFSVCILLVLLFGAKLYKDALDRDGQSFDKRTIDQYIATRIRQSDAQGLVFISSFEEHIPNQHGDTFYFVEQFEDGTYYTRIYCHNGYLYELFAAADDAFERADGEQILPLKDLSFRLEGDLLHICITHTDGTQDTLTITLRSGQGGSYEE